MMNWIKGSMKLSKVQMLCIICSTLLLSSYSSKSTDAEALDELIDGWHLSASNANFEDYFNATTDDFMFLGTAPGEEWDKDEFMTFSKPYFDKGKAWDFKSKERSYVFSKNKKVVWFYETLDTWMKDCRGSGVAVKVKGDWKLSFYNLTVLIENEKMDEFLELRSE